VTVTGDVFGSIRSMDSNLVAALLGVRRCHRWGVASLAGSVIVNRLQLRREMRIRMYDDLLPKLAVDFVKTDAGITSSLAPEIPVEFQLALAEMKRASVIAGRTDAARVEELSRLVSNRNATYEAVKPSYAGTKMYSPDDVAKLEKQAEEIGRTVFELNDYLARKLV
jgi:hypothetical protein